MRRITEIIIHCSATPEAKISRWTTFALADLARHFADIGYHYVIYR